MRIFETTTLVLATILALPGCEAIVKWNVDALSRDTAMDTPDAADTVDTGDPADVPDEPDVVEDTITDTETDGPVECPPDDATHLYIRSSGTVRDIVSNDPIEGVYVAAVAPADALTNPVSPPILASTVSNPDGTFDLGCIDVKNVNIGLVLLVDDSPRDSVLGDYFPTGELAKIWLSDADKVDVTDVPVYALSTVHNGWIVAASGVDTTSRGLVMGFVVDGNDGSRLNSATVDRVGLSLDVVYPAADWTSVTAAGGTSANGSFIVTQDVTMASITADRIGYSFDSYIASTVPAFCLFLLIEGIPV